MAIVDGHIRCSTCRESKPVGEFAPSVAAQGSGACRKCKRDLSRALSPEKKKRHSRRFLEKNPNYWRRQKMLRNYGITLEQYDAMLALQGGGCACCGTSENGEKPLFIDHDHATGAIRGILCHDCNAGIGALGDSIDGVRRALSYLERVAIAAPVYGDRPCVNPRPRVHLPPTTRINLIGGSRG